MVKLCDWIETGNIYKLLHVYILENDRLFKLEDL